MREGAVRMTGYSAPLAVSIGCLSSPTFSSEMYT